MTEFSLRQLVADALDRSPTADPRVVAAEVAQAIPPKQLRAALASVLPYYVTGVVTASRHHVPVEDDEQATSTSKRWAAASSILLAREFVAGEWKRLRDCTADNLLWIANDRRSRAAAYVTNAEKLEKLVAVMGERGADVVGDLDEDTVREVLA